MSTYAEDFSQFGISVEEKDKLVAEVIRYVLFKSEQNSGCPIKREDLTQLITGKNYRQRNLPAFVINEAKLKLSSIFGFEMRELQRSRSSTQNARSSQQGLVLIIALNTPIINMRTFLFWVVLFEEPGGVQDASEFTDHFS